MARIRTIKPEFWTDEDMLEFSDSVALFYTSLWNFCDDEGKIQNHPKTIAKLTARWSHDKVKKFLSTLTANGQLQVSMCSAWLRVVEWSHQKINKPIQPKVLMSDIEWVTENDSGSIPVAVTEDTVLDKERKGKERKGKDIYRIVSKKIKDQGYFESESVVEKSSADGDTLPDKLQIFEEIFSDEIWMEGTKISHPGKNYEQAFDECWRHHSVKPTPPVHAWEWKQKLNTWLINSKTDGTTKIAGRSRKQEHTAKLAEAVAKTYSNVFNARGNGEGG